jgi:glycyl-tRNA synthetase alpha chain
LPASTATPLTFQQLLFRLQSFWAERGCVLQQPFDIEVGAGTMSPETFLRVLGPRPVHLAYAQPSRRPADGRYGENPNRLYKHTQFQVILKPPPSDVQEVYLQSLAAIGIDLREHDIKFEEDNWEWPVGGAWGVGWQVMLDGLEITQFTYFQQCGGMDLDPITGEITYGLERIAAFLQDVDSIYDIVWARDPRTGTAVTYGDMRLEEELQLSVYSFEAAEVPKLWEHLRLYEAECSDLLAAFRDAEQKAGRQQEHHDRLLHDSPESARSGARPGDARAVSAQIDVPKPPPEIMLRRFPVLGAYELCLKCSHVFNLLDARGAISVTERVAVMARIRTLVVGVARAYAAQQKAAQHTTVAA